MPRRDSRRILNNNALMTLRINSWRIPGGMQERTLEGNAVRYPGEIPKTNKYRMQQNDEIIKKTVGRVSEKNLRNELLEEC